MNKQILATSNFNTIMNVCDEAKENSKMISIVGYPGAGKTTGLKYVANNQENVYYVKVTSSMKPKQFYSNVLNALGVEGRDTGVSLYDMIMRVSLRLTSTSTKKLLIIDEAGKFSPPFLEYLHELRDNTMEHTGIILGGPEYFHENFQKWKENNVNGMPELYRRINHWVTLEYPSYPEVKAFCEAYNISDRKVVSSILKKSVNFSDVENLIEEYHLESKKMKK